MKSTNKAGSFKFPYNHYFVMPLQQKAVEVLKKKAQKFALQNRGLKADEAEKARKEEIRRLIRARASKQIITLSENASMPALHLVKPGDILASLDTKSWVSRGLAKANNTPYPHIGVFVGRNANSELIIRDFRKGRRGINRPFKEAHKDGVVYAVLRWEKATPQQLDAFLRNINRIKGKYDTLLLASAGVNALNEYLGIKHRVNWDLERAWTCFEQFSHAAKPSEKLIKKGVLEPVLPPLEILPAKKGQAGLDPNFWTPRIITVDAVKNKVLRVITTRKYPSK